MNTEKGLAPRLGELFVHQLPQLVHMFGRLMGLTERYADQVGTLHDSVG